MTLLRRLMIAAVAIGIGAGSLTSVAHAQCPPLTYDGEAGDDQLGISVAGAGDVDSDGYADLIIGAKGHDTGGDGAGRAYVYSGRTGSLLYTFDGEAAGDQLGVSVSGAGDVNDDGYADLIVGAYLNDAGGVSVGRAYVYSGQTGTLLHTFTGENADDYFGYSVSGAGDVNNDGYADLVIGAPGPNYDFQFGRAYVFSGLTGAVLYSLSGEARGDSYGQSVSGAGDVDSNGFADFIVGAWAHHAVDDDEGRAYVYSGETGAVLHTFSGDRWKEWLGFAVSGAGDVDGDGYDDLLVGAPGHAQFIGLPGTAYVFSGQTGAQLYALEGEAQGDWFGNSVSGAGDIDGDGFDDFIIGARFNDDPGISVGRAYVYSGQSGTLLRTLIGESADDRFGYAVSGAGDVNNDGYPDVTVGAWNHDGAGASSGAAYVFLLGDSTDTDGDGVSDPCDRCPGFDDALDADGDAIPDSCDNCPEVYNPDQTDSNWDGVGDVCQPFRDTVIISQIDPSTFPTITCLVDVLNGPGVSISGLSADSFCVSQDAGGIGSFTATELSTDSCESSICLVIDASGSMFGAGIDSAKAAAHRMADAMGPIDRLALVTFSDCIQVLQGFTSDADSLHNKINSIVASGQTAALDGVWQGVDLCVPELGTRAVIALSDGVENSSGSCAAPPDGLGDGFADDSTLIVDLALGAGIPIYTISLGTSFDPTYLIGLARGSNGAYFHAPTATEIDSVYASVTERICSRYEITYVSPDNILNGDLHDISICLQRDSQCQSCGEGTYQEAAPPAITRTLTTTLLDTSCHPSTVDLPLCGWVTDSDTPAESLTVQLFYRTDSSAAFVSLITARTDSTFCAVVPYSAFSDGSVVLQYYFTASDGRVTVADPPTAPADQYLVSFCSPPQIWVSPPSLSFTVGSNGSDSADVQIGNAAAIDATDLVWLAIHQDATLVLRDRQTIELRDFEDHSLVTQREANQQGTISDQANADIRTSSASTHSPTPGWDDQRRGPSAILYDQSDFAFDSVSTSQNFETANDAFDNQGADDFVIPVSDGSWEIESVSVLGSYSSGGGPANSVNVWFYADAAGLPGTEVFSALNVVPTFDPSFSLALIPPAVLPAGTYWVSVQANQDFTPAGQWYWNQRSVQSNAMSAWRNPGDGFGTGCANWTTRVACLGGSAVDLNFRLDGNVLTGPCSWLSLHPGTGVVPPGGSDNVTVVADATGLAPGTYNCELVITSNDPDPADNPITVPVTLTVSASCDCPFPGDINGDGFVDSVDLSLEIDIVFFGSPDPQDPNCAITRGDFNNDGFTDSVDLSEFVDHVFFGGLPPVNPCGAP